MKDELPNHTRVSPTAKEDSPRTVKNLGPNPTITKDPKLERKEN